MPKIENFLQFLNMNGRLKLLTGEHSGKFGVYQNIAGKWENNRQNILIAKNLPFADILQNFCRPKPVSKT